MLAATERGHTTDILTYESARLKCPPRALSRQSAMEGCNRWDGFFASRIKKGASAKRRPRSILLRAWPKPAVERCLSTWIHSATPRRDLAKSRQTVIHWYLELLSNIRAS